MVKRISRKQVEYIASLAKIRLTPEEIDKYIEQLGSIIGYFDKLNEVDTEGIEPTSQVTGILNKLRKDEVKDFLLTKNALSNAPDSVDGYFRTLSPFKDK